MVATIEEFASPRLAGWCVQEHSYTLAHGSVLTVPSDVVIPAAIEGTLSIDIASALDTRLVVEGANGPVSPAAEDILRSRDIPVVPDIIAIGGGVISSYFEWAQNH